MLPSGVSPIDVLIIGEKVMNLGGVELMFAASPRPVTMESIVSKIIADGISTLEREDRTKPQRRHVLPKSRKSHAHTYDNYVR